MPPCRLDVLGFVEPVGYVLADRFEHAVPRFAVALFLDDQPGIDQLFEGIDDVEIIRPVTAAMASPVSRLKLPITTVRRFSTRCAEGESSSSDQAISRSRSR